VLISDFDGTITRSDFYECVLSEVDSPACRDAWQRFVAGELTHFEALRAIFASLPANEQELMRIARLTGIEPGFPEDVRRLARHGWGVLVVSAGCEWYIVRLLADLGLDLPIIANPGRVQPGRGLELLLPVDSPYLDAETGINKAAVVRALHGEYDTIAFAGNGRADLEAARLVPPEYRFATGWLAEQLRGLGEPFRSFERWSDIVRGLTAT
jgi:HAD superfamily phosphoserine phosphatase-like hydrolase